MYYLPGNALRVAFFHIKKPRSSKLGLFLLVVRGIGSLRSPIPFWGSVIPKTCAAMRRVFSYKKATLKQAWRGFFI
jgi:hypothetical protein